MISCVAVETILSNLLGDSLIMSGQKLMYPACHATPGHAMSTARSGQGEEAKRRGGRQRIVPHSPVFADYN
jgi:hypothetical protein